VQDPDLDPGLDFSYKLVFLREKSNIKNFGSDSKCGSRSRDLENADPDPGTPKWQIWIWIRNPGPRNLQQYIAPRLQ